MTPTNEEEKEIRELGELQELAGRLLEKYLFQYQYGVKWVLQTEAGRLTRVSACCT